MPQLSDTMSAGKIIRWLKKEGEKVSRGDILAEVETEKANLEIESFHSGTLLKIYAPDGVTAKVGEIICAIGEAGEALNISKPPPTKPNLIQASSSVDPQSESVDNLRSLKTPRVAPVVRDLPSTRANDADKFNGGSNVRLKISPLARKTAQVANLDLTRLTGSGPGGRIIKRDIESALSSPLPNQTKTISNHTAGLSASTDSGANQSAESLTPLSKMREVIARRMQESVTQAPHFYLTATIDMEEVIKLRETLIKDEKRFAGLGYNHFIVKACAYALVKEPTVNCAYRDGAIYSPGAVNIGIITAIDGGLLIPVVKNVDKLSLSDLLFETKALLERARSGKPLAADLSGGTFSISNMGMFDVENFTAIINPGQGGILAVGGIKEEPAAVAGEIKLRRRMKGTVSVDHRIIDGVMAAKFMRNFKDALENPALMFI